MAPSNDGRQVAARTWAFSSSLTFASNGRAEAAKAETSLAETELAPNPVDTLDQWARFIWRNKRLSIWVLLALPVWATIRIGYALTKLVATTAYHAFRLVHWFYWRCYELAGPVARLSKAIFWSLIYPPLHMLWRSAKAIYWRSLHPLISISWRALRTMYWRILRPPLDLLRRAVTWTYRRLRELFGLLTYPIVNQGLRRNLSAGNESATREGFETPATPPERTGMLLRNAFREGLTEQDAIAWVASSQADFDALFDCLPRFGLPRPTPAALYILLGPTFAETSERQLRLLGQRLRSGAPCQRVHLYATDLATASAAERAFDTTVHLLNACSDNEFVEDVCARKLDHPPSITLTQFGPVILLVSALWGRVGSTMIFDAQTQFLIENGAIVVRIFVDHNPRPGARHLSRRDMLLRENFSNTRPTLCIVAERDDNQKARGDLRRRPEYKRRSGIRRLELELEGAKALDDPTLRWAGANAQLAIVNHAVHMAFAERVTKAPIVLETHDVLTHQIESHGWPDWVSLAGEPKALREADQRDMWRRATVSVNLTPDDHKEIAAHAQNAVFVRPSTEPATTVKRAWQDVVQANSLSDDFAASEDIDVLLWGDWHNGNVRAVEWFLENVATDPRLANKRIAIIGRVTRNVSPRLLKQHPNVVTADFVDGLGDFFERAKVLAIADQDASGVSIKAVDAIRFGHAFVSTKAGLRGLDATETFRASETAGAFADDLVELLSDPRALEQRAELARRLFKNNISHDTYERQWRDVIAMAAPHLGPTDLKAETALTPGPALHLKAVTHAPTVPIATHVAQATGAAATPARATHILAAVICTYNRYDVLPGAIESLLAQDMAESDLDIIIVDNSPDQSGAREWADKYKGTRVRYLLEPVAGLSNARNVGAEECAAKYVAYIDDDAVAAPDWAQKLVAGLRKFPKAGVAGGRIVPRWLTPRPAWLPDELVGNLSIVDWGGKTRELGRTEWIAGCNIAFERSTLLEVGGFSRALGRVGAGVALLSNEESQVIEKFADVGRNAIYVPDSTVEHLIEPARLSQEWFRRRAAWQAVSDYIKDPNQSFHYAKAAAERLRHELLSEPDKLPPGFVLPMSEREAFRRDVGLIYDVVVSMLAGGVELKEDASSNASLQDKLVARVRREVQRNPQLRAAIRKLSNI